MATLIFSLLVAFRCMLLLVYFLWDIKVFDKALRAKGSFGSVKPGIIPMFLRKALQLSIVVRH